MLTKATTYNYIIPTYGHAELTERFAKDMAVRFFTTQENWAIRSSDAFVTLFFKSLEDAVGFDRSWLSQAGASPGPHVGDLPRIKFQEHVVSSTTAQAALLPDVPMAPLTEFLRLGPMGGMGWDRISRKEMYAPGEFRDRYRTDLRSEFTMRFRDGLDPRWNAATVRHEDMTRTMLWTRASKRSRNEAAINLLQHHFVQGSGLHSPHDAAFGDAYFLLNETWKPVTEIAWAQAGSEREFRRVAKQHFTGWWHAVLVYGGFRIFYDNLTDMTNVKLALSF